MSNDSSSDLDSRIAAIVEGAVGRMRDELLHRMEETESRLRDISGHMAAESAPPEAPVAAPEPPAEPAPAAADAVPDLFEAVVAIDHGGSQQEVLAALLEGTGSFAGRSALFLTRADGAQGWGSYGFEETTGEIQDVVLSYAEGPLAALSEGNGCVPLSAEECATLCGRMGVATAAEGLLLPFVLRDRLAAALYVDRFADEPPLARQPLQLLAYVGAQAVEGLAARTRSETPTLQIAGEATAPGVELWEAPAAAAPEVAAEPEPPAPSAAEEPAPEPPVSEPTLTEPSYTPPPAVIAAPPPESPPPPAEMAVEELVEEEAAELSTEAAPPLQPETVADAEWAVPTPPLEEPAPEPPPLEPAAEPPPLEEPAEAAPAEEPPPWAETAGAGFATVEMEASPEPEPAPPEMMPPPAPSTGETTEVRPPTDVSGPGWAFTASRAAAEAGDDAQHEEARRLARLLVTEIKLYNEEQVEEGRRGNDIYARLREDIDRSRQIFNERVDETVREETDYFHEEMVRILAGGNPEALGL